MEITVPKIRSQEQWNRNEVTVRETLGRLSRDRFNFKDYCEYSLNFIEATDAVFLDERLRDAVSRLTHPDINYTINIKHDDKYKDTIKKEEDTAKRIVGVLTYAWKTIVQLIKGKATNAGDALGIYNDENINLHFARLEEMLLELKGKKFRAGVFIKENAYTKEMNEKEMDEQLVFIRLLQSILQTQTKKIIDARNRKGLEPEPEEQAEQEVEQEEEKLVEITQVVKVNEYFTRKMQRMREAANTKKDPIDQQRESRRFNAAAVRFHLHYNNARR